MLFNDCLSPEYFSTSKSFLEIVLNFRSTLIEHSLYSVLFWHLNSKIKKKVMTKGFVRLREHYFSIKLYVINTLYFNIKLYGIIQLYFNIKLYAIIKLYFNIKLYSIIKLDFNIKIYAIITYFSIKLYAIINRSYIISIDWWVLA